MLEREGVVANRAGEGEVAHRGGEGAWWPTVLGGGQVANRGGEGEAGGTSSFVENASF